MGDKVRMAGRGLKCSMGPREREQVTLQRDVTVGRAAPACDSVMQCERSVFCIGASSGLDVLMAP